MLHLNEYPKNILHEGTEPLFEVGPEQSPICLISFAEFSAKLTSLSFLSKQLKLEIQMKS